MQSSSRDVGLLGYPLLAGAQRPSSGKLLYLVLGIFLLACAATVWLTKVDRPNAAARTTLGELDGRPALLVALRPVTPLVMVLIGVAGALLLLTAVLAVGVGDGGLLLTPLVLLFVVLVPDALRALFRGPRLALGADRLDLRGWTVDAGLAWDDVESVRLDETDPRRARLVVTARAGSASWQAESHRFVLPLDRFPRTPHLSLLATALDEPTRVEVLLRRLAQATRPERAAYLDADGVAFLSGAG